MPPGATKRFPEPIWSFGTHRVRSKSRPVGFWLHLRRLEPLEPLEPAASYSKSLAPASVLWMISHKSGKMFFQLVCCTVRFMKKLIKQVKQVFWIFDTCTEKIIEVYGEEQDQLGSGEPVPSLPAHQCRFHQRFHFNCFNSASSENYCVVWSYVLSNVLAPIVSFNKRPDLVSNRMWPNGPTGTMILNVVLVTLIVNVEKGHLTFTLFAATFIAQVESPGRMFRLCVYLRL